MTLWIRQFPYAMPSTTAGNGMTLSAASSTHYTLSVMTGVAIVLVPFVLLYQGWTYWVFRRRVGAADFTPGATPLDVLGTKRS